MKSRVKNQERGSSAAPPAGTGAPEVAPRAVPPAQIVSAVMSSPLGPLRLLATEDGGRGLLCEVFFATPQGEAVPLPSPEMTDLGLIEELEPARADSAAVAVLRETARQLGEYFAGARQDFELPLHPVGTPFQLRVWQALVQIPYGGTCSYGGLASALGNAKASRAVGAANGRNPIPIIVPCHRVIGSDGSLTGFGGGEPAKRWLLELEAKVAGRQRRLF